MFLDAPHVITCPSAKNGFLDFNGLGIVLSMALLRVILDQDESLSLKDILPASNNDYNVNLDYAISFQSGNN